MYRRFELYCEGKPQNVGILIGVDELDCEDETKEFLIKDFNQYLLVPEFYKKPKPSRDVLAFFTEEGYTFFEKSIERVIMCFQKQGLFDIVEIKAPEKKQKIIYRDNLQVLIEKPQDISVVY